MRMSVESINTCIANNINGGFGKKEAFECKDEKKKKLKEENK